MSDPSTLAPLSRQAGLQRELQVVANNVANATTAGFRREGVVFSEFVRRLEGAPSLSMAHAGARSTDHAAGALRATGGTLDLAVEGEGFFAVDTPEGLRLTRAGAFLQGADGTVTTADGHPLLAGGAPLQVPADAGALTVAPDGTLSTPLGPIGRIDLVRPADAAVMTRGAGTLLDPGGPVEPAEGRLVQGHLESSNVDPVREMARLIAVQRAYELGQRFLTGEHERLREAARVLGGQ